MATPKPEGQDEHVALLEKVYLRLVKEGTRDDPLTIEVGEAVEAAKPQPKAEAPKAHAKTHS